MHVHDRTLLASLGFADKDKQDPTHDLACQYVGQSEILVKLATRLMQEKAAKKVFDNLRFRVERFLPDVPDVAPARFEVMIQKGEGKYRSTIGFVDLMFSFEARCEMVGVAKVANESGQGEWVAETRRGSVDCNAAIEVKITPVGPGEIIRQINLYREYLKEIRTWVVATAFPMNGSDLDMLRASNIHHVRLGQSFLDWVAEQHRRRASESGEDDRPSIEL
jgi:hypothetical protein